MFMMWLKRHLKRTNLKLKTKNIFLSGARTHKFRIYFRVEIQNYFIIFFVQVKTIESAFEIIWPLQLHLHKVSPHIQFEKSRSTTRKWSAETEWWWWWIYHVIKTLLATLKRSPNTKETKEEGCKGNLLLLAREMILSLLYFLFMFP